MIRAAFPNTGIPVGRQAARQIPWWASSKVTVTTSNDGGGAEFPVPGQSGNREIFARNQFAWPIYITEIRMWAVPTTLVRTTYFESMKKTAFRFKSSREGYINSKWLPGFAFQTENDRHLMGYMNGIVYTLPTGFYLGHGATPVVELIALNSNLNSRYMQTMMRGYDPTNNRPIAVAGRLATAGTAGSNTTIYAYDDGRDQHIRDMWVRDFTFANVSFDSSGYSRDPWINLSARFDIPEGPHWTLDERTPLVALADQVTAYNLGDETGEHTIYPDPPVIHRPVTPYRLLPGDLMQAEIKLLDNTFWTMQTQVNGETISETMDIWVHFKGYQEGTHVS
jgi:hypothetical protein